MRKDILEKKVDKSKIHEYQAKVISLGYCDFFLPTTISEFNISGIKLNDEWSIRTDVTGMKRLDAFDEFDPVTSLDVFQQSVRGLYDNAMCYIFPSEYKLSINNIYADSKVTKIRCLFEPIGISDYEVPLIDAIRNSCDDFADQLLKWSARGSDVYIKDALNMISNSGKGIESALINISRLKKKAKHIVSARIIT